MVFCWRCIASRVYRAVLWIAFLCTAWPSFCALPSLRRLYYHLYFIYYLPGLVFARVSPLRFPHAFPFSARPITTSSILHQPSPIISPLLFYFSPPLSPFPPPYSTSS